MPLHALAVSLVLALTASTASAQDAQRPQLVIRSINQQAPAAPTSDDQAQSLPVVHPHEQRAAINRSQLRRLCAWPLQCGTPPAPPRNAPRLNLVDYSAEIALASATWGVDSALVRAVIHAESAFKFNAVSPKGAQGLMQLMPATAQRFNVSDAFDPAQNIGGGVQYLAWLLARFDGDERLATAAYNAGEGAVDRHAGIPPYRETQAYVVKVEELAQAYRASQQQVALSSATQEGAI